MPVAVRVIPCLDVDGGRVVKGVNFRDLRDAGDPVQLAGAYDAEGADELGGGDDRAGRGDVPVQAGDEPDQAEGGQRELGHHQQGRPEAPAA